MKFVIEDKLIKKLYEVLKKKKVYGIFISEYMPLKMPSSKTYPFRHCINKLQSNKIIVENIATYEDNTPLCNATIIESLLCFSKKQVINKLTIRDIVDLYLEEYFKENKEKYPNKKPRIYYAYIISIIITIIATLLALVTFFIVFKLKMTLMLILAMIVPCIISFKMLYKIKPFGKNGFANKIILGKE